VHREEQSVNARVGHEEWKEVTIALPPGAGASPLRIDFVSPLTIVEIAALQLRGESKIHFTAARPSQFDEIAVRGDAERLVDSKVLRLKITGIDPQLYLPPLDPGFTEEKLRLEMRVRILPCA
jgi:hypothetical protein